ncbi:MAG: helix-turn-helix domain-containing protein [Bacteroidales bacterium]|nr:helix-turn-helix domain-containing protein [Bacteroidales bacterium]
MQFDNNPIAELAARYINNTSRNVFLTGKAGTGKTTFLRNINQYTHKNTIVAAPTGIAAINAGGITLHSLFQLPFGAFVPGAAQFNKNITFQVNTPKSLIESFQMNNNKRNLLRELELLIIDEVSMLRADLLDAIDTILRFVRRKKELPFGGVQLLFIGDLQQLPPVVNDEEWSLLSGYYAGIYFYNAWSLRQAPPLYIELETIYRQHDHVFINLLNNLRENKITTENINLLNSHFKPGFKAEGNEGHIHLTTHNRLADETNHQSLRKLKGRSFFYDAIIEDDFSEYLYPVEYTLELKEGAQVMFIKNDYSGAGRYFNGKIGTVSSLGDGEIVVSFSDGTQPATVDRYVWENKKYTLNPATNEIEEKIAGRFSHFPLRLAWAITVHKSQGLTFDKAIIDVSRAFAPGQIYVALSRLTSLDGLVLLTPLPSQLPPQDEGLSLFSRQKKELNELQTSLQTDANRYISEAVLNAFDFNNLTSGLKYHISTYDKDESKSIKQHYKRWAENLLKETLAIKEVADKFILQLRNIAQQQQQGYLSLMHQRLVAAKEYFEPLLNGISTKINEKISDLSQQKKIKKFVNELTDTERLYYRQLRLVYKAEALVLSVLNNTPVTKETLRNSGLYNNRVKPATQAPAKREKKPKTGKKENKTDKTDTKLVSLDLFNQGKTIEEIAKERGFVVTTIEGHLAHYVREGSLAIDKLINTKDLAEILSAIDEFETTSLSSLMEALGQKYSYGKLRMAVAYFLKNSESGLKE